MTGTEPAAAEAEAQKPVQPQDAALSGDVVAVGTLAAGVAAAIGGLLDL